MKAPLYIVFAGINGAGKSTYYHTGDWKAALPYLPRKMKRVNSDEILVQMGGNPESKTDQLAAGKAALKEIEALFEQGKSFNQETTLAGHVALKHIKRAKKLGYQVFLFYIGLESSDLAIERIAHRVETGGHPIDSSLVRKRYERSLSNLAQAIDYCEEVLVLDNTKSFMSLMQWFRGTMCWCNNPENIGAWLFNAITDPTIWKH